MNCRISTYLDNWVIKDDMQNAAAVKTEFTEIGLKSLIEGLDISIQ